MRPESNSITVRVADLAGVDREAVGQLVSAYLRQTETEKAAHLPGSAIEAELPERYRGEIADPERAYEGAVVYIAEWGRKPVGVVVVQRTQAIREIKRVWSDPTMRGHGVGSALMEAAISQRDLPIRLTVWDWRTDAVRLYSKRGFAPVASWEARPRLLCMELPRVDR